MLVMSAPRPVYSWIFKCNCGSCVSSACSRASSDSLVVMATGLSVYRPWIESETLGPFGVVVVVVCVVGDSGSALAGAVGTPAPLVTGACVVLGVVVETIFEVVVAVDRLGVGYASVENCIGACGPVL